jgi:hypothetical protein
VLSFKYGMDYTSRINVLEAEMERLKAEQTTASITDQIRIQRRLNNIAQDLIRLLRAQHLQLCQENGELANKLYDHTVQEMKK